MWLHGDITREDAEALIKEQGLQSGQFLVRQREGQPGQYVLCVAYKNKPTHHLVAKNDDGNYCVNKKVYGAGSSDIVEAISVLQQPTVAGWPVPLLHPVAARGAVAPVITNIDDDAAAAAAAAAAVAKAADVALAAKAAEDRIARAEAALLEEHTKITADAEVAAVKAEAERGAAEAVATKAAAAEAEVAAAAQPAPVAPSITAHAPPPEMDDGEEAAQESLAEAKAVSAVAAAAAAAQRLQPTPPPSSKDHPAARLMPQLPEGWQMVPSRSNLGEYVYENIHTNERQSWVPKESAALSVGQLRAAVNANDMERELAQRRLSEVRAMQHLATTTSGALGPEQEERRRMELLIQQQQYQLETEERATSKMVSRMSLRKSKSKKKGKEAPRADDAVIGPTELKQESQRSSQRRRSSEESLHSTKGAVSQKRRLREAQARLNEQEAELLGAAGKSDAARRLAKKLADVSRASDRTAKRGGSVTVVDSDGLYVTAGGHVDRAGTFSHV